MWPAFAALLLMNEIRVDRYQAVAMRDGVKLYADVYRPAAPGKYPVLVVRTPYGTQRDGMHENLIKFAQRGYAVVTQDVRGRFESEGKWEPFRNEAKDGYDTIEWAAAQNWSNGKVATQGGSYLGHTQWAAASQSPPHLLAMYPAVASTNIYATWLTRGGAFRLSFNYGWGVVRMPNRIMLPQYWHTEAYTPEELKYDRILTHLPLKDGDLRSANYAVQHYRDWLKHQSFDEYWKGISSEDRFEKITVPAHTLGGWFDIFLGGTINGYTGMRARAGSEKARKETKMIIGPWGHGPSQKFGDIDFGPSAMVNAFDHELRWFDHYLKGEDNGIDREAPVRLYYMGANVWRDEQDWPIPGTTFTPFYLSSGRKVSLEKSSDTGSDQYLYDPANPVPTIGGNNCCGSPTLAGPKDQRPLERRPDVLVYTGEVISAPVAIAGPVKMHLFASTDGRDTDWMVKLVDVYPDGFAMNIAEGMLRARFHQGLDKPELLTPGQVYEFEIDLLGTANVFQPGHRIRVDITSSNFPQFDRNPNTGDDLGASATVRTAAQTVFHGGVRASSIVLPVVPLPR